MAWAGDPLRKSGFVITERLLNLGGFKIFNLIETHALQMCLFEIDSFDRCFFFAPEQGTFQICLCKASASKAGTPKNR